MTHELLKGKRLPIYKSGDMRPEPWGVLYAKPNPDGSRKKCENCVSWAKKDKECYFFNPNFEVVADGVCGYHIYSPDPMESFPTRINMRFLEPSLAGYEVVPGGTSCDLCVHYNASDSTCNAVQVDGKPANVNAKGCCARWVRK